MTTTDTRTLNTPGPWLDTGLPAERAIVIAADGPVHVCRIIRDSMNADANARLIAAAPTMADAILAAIRYADFPQSPETFDMLVNAARAAGVMQ